MRKCFYKFLLLSALCLFPALGLAQYSVQFINGGTITVDGLAHPTGTILDDGGTGVYGNSVYAIVNISARPGDSISIWGSYDIESSYDYLRIFDGADGTGAEISVCTGSGYLSTSTISGCLSLVWSTDGSVQRDGFELSYQVSRNDCENSVFQFYSQNVGATWTLLKWTAADTTGQFLLSWPGHDTTVTGSSLHLEGLEPNSSYAFSLISLDDTGANACGRSTTVNTPCFQANINGVRPLCGTDTVTLTSDSADSYLWSTGATTRSIAVTDSGWYTLTVFTDGGCADSLTVNIGGIKLDMDITVPASLCPGDSAVVRVGLSGDASVRILKPESTLSEAARIFLPDGQYCEPNGCSYRSELNFSGFANDAHINSVNDIRYLMLNIEHSYIGDIYINITCPNSQSADILKYGGSGTSACNSSITSASRGWTSGSNMSPSTFLGNAYDMEGTNYCDSTDPGNAPGQGWRYCWSNCNDADFSYSAGDGLIYRSWNAHGGKADSSNVAAGTNFYHPDESFSSLIGCPMNGVWYVEVIDGWSVDNGYIFGWELALNPNRLRRDEYVPTVAWADLTGPYAVRRSDTTFTITAPLTLTHDTTVTYTVTITDSLGCSFDTTFTILFRATSTTNIYDTVVQNALPVRYGGRTFMGDTVYSFHYPSGSGCDSLVVYHLYVRRNTQATFDTTICSDQLPLMWHSLNFASAGSRTLHTSNHAGADSAMTFVVHVNPAYSFTQTANICDNNSYLFEGVSYNTTGVYQHHLTTQGGCDSLRTLNLTVRHTGHGDTIAYACDQFTWRGATFANSDSLTVLDPHFSSEGCDSLLTLHLTILHSTQQTVYDTILENDLPRNYNGYTLNNDVSNMTVTLTNMAGCDSIIHYNLHVLRNSFAVFDTAFCADRLPIQWYHRIFYTAGTQYDTLENHVGADSLLTLTLGLYPVYDDTIPASICDNQSYTFEGQQYSAAGYYTHTLATAHGCDSLRTLALAIRNTSHGDTIANECDQFTWHGTTFNSSDTMTAPAPVLNAAGCDSTVTLHLTIRHSTSQTVYDTILENDLPRLYNGYTLNSDTSNMAVTLTNGAGCDSNISYNLHVLRNSYAVFDTAFCADRLPIQWYHRIFYAPGTQYDTLENHVGADSLLTLTLGLYPVYDDTIPASVCDNQSYTFEGQQYSAAGYYTHTFATAHGCDSLRTLSLAIRNTSHGDTIANECDQFSWHGTTFNSSDTMTALASVLNAAGCDSTVTLHLTIRHSTDTSFAAESCDSYTWFGTTYLSTPTLPLTYTLTNSVGCDSLLQLTGMVLHYRQHLYDTAAICENLLAGGYAWRDTALAAGTASGNFMITRTDQYGCDSIMHLALTVHTNTAGSQYDTIVENQAATWQYHGTPVTTDTTLDITIANQWGCDSVVSYHLYIWPNVSGTADTHICDNHIADFSWYGQGYAATLTTVLADRHGADSTVTLTVHVDSTFRTDIYDTICDNQTASFGGQTLSLAGDYEHTFPTQQLCDSVVTLHLTVHPTYSAELYDTIYVGDTIVFDGIYEFVEPGDYPIHYLTEFGCDSLITLHIAGRNLHFVRRADTICVGGTYHFGSRELTEAGTYIDTVLSGDFFSGDTIVELTLSVVEAPNIAIKREYVCDDPAHFVLTGQTNASYLKWMGYGVEESFEHDSIITLPNPADTSLVTLYVDYRERPMCPTTMDMELMHIAVVNALIDVRPTSMTLEERNVVATNVSSGPVESHLWYLFYNDGLVFSDTARRLNLQVPMFVDSVMIVLEVSSSMCSDADTVKVDVLRSDILFPNIFTPNMTTNNRFRAYTTAVTEFELWVFDRRGDLVFHSTDIDEEWDGTSNGAPCPQASYVYKCRYRDEVTPGGYQTVTGTVTLVR